MKPILFAAALLMTVSAAFAQSTEALSACMQTANDQTGMAQCASDAVTRINEALDLLVQQLVTAATESGDKQAVIKILSSERAWTNYRDAYIEAMYPATDKSSVYGTSYPMEANLLRIRLTRNHMEDLQRMLERYQAAQ